MTALHPATAVLAAGLWPTVALVIFLVIFVGIIIYVFAVPKSVWNKDAKLPLEDATRARNEKEKTGE